MQVNGRPGMLALEADNINNDLDQIIIMKFIVVDLASH